MPPFHCSYHLQAIHDFELIDEVFPTLNKLVSTYGKRLNITHKKCISIRGRNPATRDRYKHIMITEIPNAPTPYKETSLTV